MVVSDVARGPDWWLASDGKWYPPTSRPGVAPPPPPGWHHPGALPVSRPLSGALTAWMQAVFWIAVASNAVLAIVTGTALARFNAYQDAVGASQFALLVDWFDADDLRVGWGVVDLLVWVGAIILLMVWMNKAHKATSVLWPGDRKWTSGWTVGGWFIPLANLVIPRLVLNEMDRIATAPRAGARVGDDWRHRPIIGIGMAWWLLMVLAIAIDAVGGTMLNDAFDPVRDDLGADEVRAGYGLVIVGALVWCASLTCGALYVRRLGRQLRALA